LKALLEGKYICGTNYDFTKSGSEDDAVGFVTKDEGLFELQTVELVIKNTQEIEDTFDCGS
jgi:hypothetical protein